MSGAGWSCFAQLPPGLIDDRSASLTLNWLRPKPTLAGFMLKRSDVDEQKYRRNLRIRRLALFAGTILAAGVASIAAADLVWALDIFSDDAAVFAAVWMTTSSAFLAVIFYAAASIAAMRFRRAEPRRIAFGAACMEYEQIDAWRRVRCDPEFWSEGLDDAGFEIEAAELLAGHLKTGQVMLTRGSNDYGVDVLLCSPGGRIVAQCKQWRGRKAGAPEVRGLAGSKAFFGADLGILMSLKGPSEDREQCARFAETQNLQFWNLEAIVGAAARMRGAV